MIRTITLALALPLLFASCMAQRETPEMPEMETETTGGGMTPNGPVVIAGAWVFTATEIGGEETLSGTLTIEEGVGHLSLTDGFEAPLAIYEMEVTNANFLLGGTIETSQGPLPLSLAGSIAGDEMSAEAEVMGRGTYAFTGTRRPN